jgi:hypothetical protein
VVKYLAILVVMASCTPKNGSHFYESRKYLRQVKTDHINFFGGIKEGWLMKLGKADWILSFDEKDTLRYVFPNNKTKHPYWKVNYINDSILILSRRRDLRYTMMDSFAFYKNGCLLKYTTYDQNRVRAMDSTTMVNCNAAFYMFDGNVFRAFDEKDFQRYGYFYYTPIVTVLNEVARQPDKHPFLRFWHQKSYANDTALHQAKMEFFNQHAR